jgi:uracil-DNA glycosylase
MTLSRYALVANVGEDTWEGMTGNVKGRCNGCPRDPSKMPLVFSRYSSPALADFLVLSQEPGYWLRSLRSGEAAEQRLAKLCKESESNSEECKKANPLSKVIQIFGNFDPTRERVYLTHALKCLPPTSDKDINKEWRKAATRCEEHLIAELRLLGKAELYVVAFGKFALEMCLNVFEGQDIDQDISISEFMQSSRLPLSYRYKFKDGTVKNITLFVFTNPSSEIVKIRKSGGRMTVEEIQELETARIREILKNRKSR